jgi:hypothetical protein
MSSIAVRDNSEVLNNAASQGGAGLYLTTSAVGDVSGSTLAGNRVTGNYAGGATYLDQSSLYLAGARIENNTCGNNQGSGIFT